eukprot:TRINITY_DN7772_c0_g1_i1.p1 TRINITY_DN7772_c0_g1~~TRINITY_DN7772_c0_g1_i1.p1  ORF type:complete len:335 (-),score=70.66 TRINITY_DN7772_c0_g1_i1:62-1066(-)
MGMSGHHHQVLVPIQQVQMLQSSPSTISFVQIPQADVTSSSSSTTGATTTILVKEQPSPSGFRVKPQEQYSIVQQHSQPQQQQFINVGVPVIATSASVQPQPTSAAPAPSPPSAVINLTSAQAVVVGMSPPRSISSNSMSSSNTGPSILESSGCSTILTGNSGTVMTAPSISENSETDKPRRTIQKRNRSAAREDLKFIHVLEDGSNDLAKIRVWVNDKNMAFYDCSCEKRKPVQDLNKIKLHVMGHLVKRYTCSVCSRDFANYRQLNGHLRIHQSNRRKEVASPPEGPVAAATPVVTFMGPPLQPARTVLIVEAAAPTSAPAPAPSIVYNVLQ